MNWPLKLQAGRKTVLSIISNFFCAPSIVVSVDQIGPHTPYFCCTNQSALVLMKVGFPVFHRYYIYSLFILPRKGQEWSALMKFVLPFYQIVFFHFFGESFSVFPYGSSRFDSIIQQFFKQCYRGKIIVHVHVPMGLFLAFQQVLNDFVNCLAFLVSFSQI